MRLYHRVCCVLFKKKKEVLQAYNYNVRSIVGVHSSPA